ncbi:MAG: L-threonylcarbamoyladenylate synthase [Alphaproteobacteria bacterium]|nr:L-threonylcarbamoyladenylate synthase [Alphaproteobacteria bacterium]
MMSFISLDEAIAFLHNKKAIVFPTETVYGLGADATSDMAIAEIYRLKNRPSFNPLIVHFYSIEQAQHYVEFSDLALKLGTLFWPGPLTLILPLKSDSPISKLASAGLQTLGVRIPNHPIALELLKKINLPLAAPSANVSGKISPTKAVHVHASFGDNAPNILEGGTSVIGLESTILDLSGPIPTLLRPGFVSFETLKEYIPNLIIGCSTDKIDAPLIAPGQLKSHYAPNHKIRLNVTKIKENEVLLAFGPHPLATKGYVYNLSEKGDLVEAASHFFEALHILDAQESSGIAVMPIPNEGLGGAINDRLSRAAACNEITSN